MSFTRWLRNLQSFCQLGKTSRKSRRPARSAPAKRCQLQLETLEDRVLPSFSPVVMYPAGTSPQAVVTGDFNGDGKLDLAVVNNSSNTVSVLLGNANGTFQPAQNFATGAGPRSLAVGDFNSDGKLDIVTANVNDVSVLLGNGNGTFQAPRSLVLPYQSTPSDVLSPQSASSVVVGDLNGDGKLDLVVRGATAFSLLTGGTPYGNAYSPYTDGYANVLLGNGDGSFSPKATYLLAHNVSGAVTESALDLALGDFNGDGKLDIVAFDSNGVSVLRGNGDGTFQAPAHSAGSGSSLVAGDLNGDGKLDLVVGGSSMLVLKGNGDGTFQAGQTLAVGSNVRSVVLGDVNGDGKLDIAALTNVTRYASYGPYGGYNPTTTEYVNVLLGHGDGSFGLPASSTVDSHAGINDSSFDGAALADFNGDGRPDLAVTNSYSNSVSVLLNDGIWSAVPAQPSSFVVSGFPSSTTAGAPASFTVTAKNTDGTTAANYAGTVHFTSTDPLAVLPANYTFTGADQGVHTFTATLKTTGTQSITTTDTTTASVTGSETGITVSPAAASHLSVSAPAGSTAGSAFSVTLTARDPYNNIATGYTGTIHFTSSDPKAALLADYTFTAADKGVHTFSNGVTLKTAGGQTVTAADAVTSSITGGAAVAVDPAAASTMTVTGFPSPATAGVARNFTVTLRDPYGNIASGYTGTVHITSTDGKATLPANYTFSAADAGTHVFNATLKTSGTQSITVADSAIGGLSGSEAGITVNPATASKYLISAPPSVQSGVAFSLTLTIQDAYGNVVTGYTGTVHFTSSDMKATLPANYNFTSADRGVHTFSGLILRTRGTQKITLTDTLNSSLTGSVVENVL